MNRSRLAGIILVALLVSSTPVVAFASEVSLGLKLWSSAWKETVVAANGNVHKTNNGSELMVGPSLHVGFWEDFFADVTYLKARGEYESPDWFVSGDTMKLERADADLLAGYLLRDPHNDLTAGLFIAYKAIDAPARYTNQAAGLNAVDMGTWKLKGPGIGLLAEKPVNATTKVAGSIAYYMLQQEFAYSSGSVTRFDSGGWTLDIAVGHAFMKKLSVDAGLKYQRFKGEMVDGSDVTESFSGLTAGITYRF